MAKAPLPGSVKTRLVPPLTPEQAADLSRALLLDQLEHLKQLDDVDRYVAYAPGDAEAIMRTLGGADYQYFAQSGRDLGARMQQVFTELWRRGYHDVVLIGGDLAPLPLQILNHAFTQLSSHQDQIVLGPSADGGYYLVGMNRPTPEIFADMNWSHDRVLAQTVSKLDGLSIAYRLLPAWFDLDRAEDIERFLTVTDPAVRQAMGRTLAIIERLNFSNCFAMRKRPSAGGG